MRPHLLDVQQEQRDEREEGGKQVKQQNRATGWTSWRGGKITGEEKRVEKKKNLQSDQTLFFLRTKENRFRFLVEKGQ